MFLVDIFSKMKSSVESKVGPNKPGLYVSIIFPIAFAFLLTFIGARIISHIDPDFYIPFSNIHVHHFAYGFFILAASGYLALTFNGPQATFLIALLHGFGLGLAFDEFGIWLHLQDTDPARFSYDGFIIIVGAFFLILSAGPGVKLLKKLWSLR